MKKIIDWIKSVKDAAEMFFDKAKLHAETRRAMAYFYQAILTDECFKETNTTCIITIEPYGNVFRITETIFMENEKDIEKTWLGAFTHFPGTFLLQIGGDRYCIFNPAKNEMYLQCEFEDEPLLTCIRIDESK
ncbi:hypothetical protein SAMN05192574_103573 [Mucilaginibacter gossypiicola]|uniref:Uncharacterized protein n=1 Tax=Mucilaginibacter gossypiicola TaxID=551995 RepID=A0A1H8HN59_9SPHI|nr:hypothetical protein [Mucilaginibacter gossypiicola]SEN57651.1 hypothetical protein SAMN05192574_103573 [Mucilaginibacter gossypiicola]